MLAHTEMFRHIVTNGGETAWQHHNGRAGSARAYTASLWLGRCQRGAPPPLDSPGLRLGLIQIAVESVQQAKAFFRHNDRDRRQEGQHTNPHIDKSKTHENFTYRGLSYKSLCKAFDDRLAAVDMGRESTGKNARVVLQSVVLYPPKGLTREQEKDWFMDAGKVLEARYGDNFVLPASQRPFGSCT